MGVPNCSRTLLQPRVMMKDCLPTRLHSVSRDTEHLNTQTSSSGRGGKTRNEGGKPGMGGDREKIEVSTGPSPGPGSEPSEQSGIKHN